MYCFGNGYLLILGIPVQKLIVGFEEGKLSASSIYILEACFEKGTFMFQSFNLTYFPVMHNFVSMLVDFLIFFDIFLLWYWHSLGNHIHDVNAVLTWFKEVYLYVNTLNVAFYDEQISKETCISSSCYLIMLTSFSCNIASVADTSFCTNSWH